MPPPAPGMESSEPGAKSRRPEAEGREPEAGARKPILCSQHLLGENLHHREWLAVSWRLSLMQNRPRRARSVLSSSLTLLLLAFVAIPSRAAEKAHLRVEDYQIEVELTPHLHQMSGRAKVKFTALQDLTVAVFELHNDLRVTRVLDDQNQPLSAERVTQDSTVRVPLPAGLSKGASTTLTFEYEGQIETADDSPVPGLKLAYIGDDTSYLLYAGRWFPVSRSAWRP